MKVLLPRAVDITAPELLARVVAAPRLPPFAPALVEFVSAVSAETLADRSMRAYPELLALAHWFRPAELRRLQLDYASQSSSHHSTARGTVFHVAPSNVDSMFVYPWLIALLLGNKNIVRISRRHGEASEALLATIARVLERPGMSAMLERSLVVTYDHQEDTTRALSEVCDVRAIWGSDETIRSVRAVALPVQATEITFSDRFSLALLAAEVVAGLSERALAQLAHAFCNDCLWFDQLACSSPRAVVWLGSAARVEQAKQHFWPAVSKRAAQFTQLTQPALAVTRLATACHAAAALGGGPVTYDHAAGLARVQIPSLEPQHRVAHQGAGLFFETCCQETRELAAWLRPVDQTLVHFGVDGRALEALVDHGLDRIVPVGDALHFETTWDGVDLMRAFTRECVLRVMLKLDSA